MKTEKIYEKNCYQRDFIATVVACIPQDNRYLVVLDKTAFFPEQGGQYADKGSLNGTFVIDVQIIGGEICHIVNTPFTPGQKVDGRIDWETRFSRMQTHTGEHILSGVIYKEYGFDNVGFHLGDGYATVDTSGPMSPEMIAIAEKKANEIIYQNKRITFSYPTLNELSTLSYRSKIEAQEGIRLVTIDGCDVCACCAPHLSTTGQVGVIKVVKSESHKGGTRLTIQCGTDAYATLCSAYSLAQDACRLLSATPDTLLGEIARLTERQAEAEREIKSLKLKCAASTLTFTPGAKLEYAFIDGDAETLRALAASFTTDTPRILLAAQSDAFLYVLFSQSTDVRPLVKELNTALNGKGGGTPTFAQGKFFTTKKEILEWTK